MTSRIYDPGILKSSKFAKSAKGVGCNMSSCALAFYPSNQNSNLVLVIKSMYQAKKVIC